MCTCTLWHKAFDTMKGELMFARRRNTYGQMDFHNHENDNMGGEVAVFKREARKKGSGECD